MHYKYEWFVYISGLSLKQLPLQIHCKSKFIKWTWFQIYLKDTFGEIKYLSYQKFLIMKFSTLLYI